MDWRQLAAVFDAGRGALRHVNPDLARALRAMADKCVELARAEEEPIALMPATRPGPGPLPPGVAAPDADVWTGLRERVDAGIPPDTVAHHEPYREEAPR